jgi:hypothetical protein
MDFNEYLVLHEKYEVVFNKIFERYYKKGYFGDIPKEEIKISQYKWFCKLANAINEKKHDKIIPFITNHNNKVTRSYFSNLFGEDIALKGKKEIIELLKKD